MSTSSLQATTSGYFKIIGVPDQPLITINSPVGGEVWPVGTKQRILWKTNNISSPNDKITIYLDAASDQSDIYGLAQQIPNTGYFDYTVVDPIKYKPTSPLYRLGKQFRLMVCAKLATGASNCSYARTYGSGVFTISSSTLAN